MYSYQAFLPPRGPNFSVPYILLQYYRDNEQLVGSRMHESNEMEVRWRESKGDQGRKEAVLVRTSA